ANDPCDTDHNLCTLEHCYVNGMTETCVPSTPSTVNCTPSSVDCTANTCDPADGTCKLGPAAENTLCTDTDPLDCKNNACDGVSQGTAGCTKLRNCTTCANTPCSTDGDPCTRGVCNASGSCGPEGPFTNPDPTTIACANDNNVCTKDVCSLAGTC